MSSIHHNFGEKLDHHSQTDNHDHHHANDESHIHVPKAMHIYEPWMEPDYYVKKQKISKQTHGEREYVHLEEKVQAGTVTDTGAAFVEQQPKKPLPISEVILDEDPSDFIAWVMNGRMDDIGDVEKKLFKK